MGVLLCTCIGTLHWDPFPGHAWGSSQPHWPMSARAAEGIRAVDGDVTRHPSQASPAQRGVVSWVGATPCSHDGAAMRDGCCPPRESEREVVGRGEVGRYLGTSVSWTRTAFGASRPRLRAHMHKSLFHIPTTLPPAWPFKPRARACAAPLNFPATPTASGRHVGGTSSRPTVATPTRR